MNGKLNIIWERAAKLRKLLNNLPEITEITFLKI